MSLDANKIQVSVKGRLFHTRICRWRMGCGEKIAGNWEIFCNFAC